MRNYKKKKKINNTNDRKNVGQLQLKLLELFNIQYKKLESLFSNNYPLDILYDSDFGGIAFQCFKRNNE